MATDPIALDAAALAELLDRQHGVISRRQFVALNGTPGDIERMLRRREWVRPFPGVFLNHTGEPSWIQRAWLGVAYYWPAALDGSSAIRALVGPGWRGHDDAGPIEIAVAPSRRVKSISGYRLRRMARFDDSVQWLKDPPRLRFEDAVLDHASRSSAELDAIGVLADACQSRRTTAQRLLQHVGDHRRMRHRTLITAILEDVDAGACSVLEQAYLTRVERCHGLPEGIRQSPGIVHGRRMFQDVEYTEVGLIVELDGRLFHQSARQRDLDLERDLATAADGRATVRLGWGQVHDRPCHTAVAVARVLMARGWAGRARACSPACPLSSTTSTRGGGSVVPGASDPPQTVRTIEYVD